MGVGIRTAFIHVVGDFVQGIGVLIAGILIWSNDNAPEYWIADPICTFIFAVLVVVTTLTVMRDAVHVLMEGTSRERVRESQILWEVGEDGECPFLGDALCLACFG